MMATSDQIPTNLAIDLGDDLSPEDFISAVRNFLGYVSEITNAQTDDATKISWTVRVREGSALVGVEPNGDAPEHCLALIYKKAEFAAISLLKGDICGADLSEKAMKCLKGLSDLVAKHENGSGVRLWINKKPLGIDDGLAKVVRDDWNTDYFDIGTVEGRLEAILDTSGSLKIRVKDILYLRPINCFVPENMIGKILSSFRKRVEIEGKIHYRKDGTPLKIEAYSIDVLPEDDELPTADEVRGIMAFA